MSPLVSAMLVSTELVSIFFLLDERIVFTA